MHTALRNLRARRARGEDKGFTLIELLVVVVIIGILIAIAVPLYLNYQKSSNDKAADSDVRNALTVMEQCYSDNGAYPGTTGATYSTTAPSIDLSSATTAPCDGKINLSPGTTLVIAVTPASATAQASFTIKGSNSGGHASTFFNYNSLNGGSVLKSAS